MYSTGAVSDLIGTIYEAPTHPLGLRSITQTLEKTLNGSVAVFARRPSSVSIMAICSTCPPEMAAAYENALWTHDRAMERVADVPAGGAILDSALVPSRQRLNSPFYNDYLGAVGCDRGLYLPFLKTAGDAFVLSAQRSARIGDYDDEIGLMRTLAPHMARSFTIYRRLKALEEEKVAVQLGLRQAGFAMLLVNRAGSIVFGNDAAEAELRTDLVRVTNGRVCATNRRDATKLQKAIEWATRETRAESRTIRLSTSAGVHMTVTVSPYTTGAPVPRSEPLAMLLLSHGKPKHIDERFMADEYGVTPAEMRLLRALAEGEPLKSYADRHDIRITTVKTHLTALFDKTGVRRQSDLIRFVLSASPLCGNG